MFQGGTTRRRMTIRRKDPSSSSLPVKLTPKQVRAKIIEEIISTERDYVKHLEDIIEVYMLYRHTMLNYKLRTL